MDLKVTIVLLNWNGGEDTITCLRSLSEIDYPCFRVIVVDNGSTDASPDIVARHFPDVWLIRNPVNAGFDGGSNIGIRAALDEGADAVLLLNNDTVVCPKILRQFTDAIQILPRAGVLGPKIYYFDNPEFLWWAGCEHRYSKTGWLLNYTQEGKKQQDHGQYDEIRRVDAVIGCAMFIRREVFEDVGLLDEK
ncbi:MAG: glycosyltransferase family 2 protein, partial [Candidatus Aureabacteria bacterium]|nr:glycosyltransferase family 2 protein [Candidatus Auribacterota bacterium]